MRYADDFLIGVVGSKEDCAAIKAELKGYLADVLKLELSDEKTKITHSSENARFLGYDVSVHSERQAFLCLFSSRTEHPTVFLSACFLLPLP